ncbi:ATP-binding protein [Streptomyces sp. NPDC090445]|uniref:ATP-binding protein n=1 Tax=Streptomyces sp. NPDC090445 TaxID=3365963 RepID=UPI003827EABC
MTTESALTAQAAGEGGDAVLAAGGRVVGRHPDDRRQAVQARRHAWTVASAPGSVRAVRERTERSLVLFGVPVDSSLGGAVLLVVSELVANAVRHARDSPDAEITLTMNDHLLMVGVRDRDPRPPALALAPASASAGPACGRGLRTVADLAREYGGDIRIERAADGRGKTVVVRFILPTGTP